MAQEKLTGKIAVVTGGARGIGCAIAERLLEAGVSVAFCALRQDSVDVAVARLSMKGKVLGVAADVSSLDDVRRFVGQVVGTFGGIDILVNNAAIRTYKPVMSLEPADWDRMLAVNLSGCVRYRSSPMATAAARSPEPATRCPSRRSSFWAARAEPAFRCEDRRRRSPPRSARRWRHY